MSATCNLCGKEDLVWAKTKAGKPLLMELRPHLITCTKRPKRGPDDAVEMLRALGYKVGEARSMLKGKRGNAESRVRQALKGGHQLPDNIQDGSDDSSCQFLR